MRNTQKGRVIPTLLVVIALLIAGGMLASKHMPADETAKPVSDVSDSASQPVESIDHGPAQTNGPQPRIVSITPSSGPKGSVVQVKGTDLGGFEGDIDVTFEDASGQKFVLTDDTGAYRSSDGTSIQLSVKEPCKTGETIYGRYSGIASICAFVEMKPGTYSVYVKPWDIMSNKVQFILN